MKTDNTLQDHSLGNRPGTAVNARKAAYLLLGCLALWFLGVDLLHSVGHFLHLALGVLELAAVTVGVKLLGLSHEVSQAIAAYAGLGVALYLAGRLLYRAYQFGRRALTTLLRSKPAAWLQHHWRLLLTGSGIVTVAWLFLF